MMSQVIAHCLPPRPLLVVAPKLDVDMVPEGVALLAERVQPAYEAAGAPAGRFAVHRPAHEHEFTLDVFERLAAFLQAALPPASGPPELSKARL